MGRYAILHSTHDTFFYSYDLDNQRSKEVFYGIQFMMPTLLEWWYCE